MSMTLVDLNARYAVPNRMGAVAHYEEDGEIVTVISGLNASRMMSNIIQQFAVDAAGNQRMWNAITDTDPNYDWENWPD